MLQETMFSGPPTMPARHVRRSQAALAAFGTVGFEAYLSSVAPGGAIRLPHLRQEWFLALGGAP